MRYQTLKEAQEISTALIAAEQRIGELLLAIPKSSGQYAESENRPVSKNTVVSEMGYTKDEVSDYQRMAKNPEIVQRVIQDALANGEVVTKSQVLKEIKAERDKIRAIEKVGLAEEVRKQKLKEAQAISEAVLDAEMKIGELTKKIPKATTNHKNLEINNGADFLKPKSETLEEIGIPQHTANRFEMLAKHPEAVLDAEVKIGELMRKVPKAKNNNPTGNNQYKNGQNDSGVDLSKKKIEVNSGAILSEGKMEIAKNAGFTLKQGELLKFNSSRFREMIIKVPIMAA